MIPSLCLKPFQVSVLSLSKDILALIKAKSTFKPNLYHSLVCTYWKPSLEPILARVGEDAYSHWDLTLWQAVLCQLYTIITNTTPPLRTRDLIFTLRVRWGTIQQPVVLGLWLDSFCPALHRALPSNQAGVMNATQAFTSQHHFWQLSVTSMFPR